MFGGVSPHSIADRYEGIKAVGGLFNGESLFIFRVAVFSQPGDFDDNAGAANVKVHTTQHTPGVNKFYLGCQVHESFVAHVGERVGLSGGIKMGIGEWWAKIGARVAAR